MTTNLKRTLIALLALAVSGLLGACVENPVESDSPTASHALVMPDDWTRPDPGDLTVPDIFPDVVPSDDPALNAPVDHLIETHSLALFNKGEPFAIAGFEVDAMCGSALLQAESDAALRAAKRCDSVNLYSWAELETRDGVFYENIGTACYAEVHNTYTCHVTPMAR